MKLLLVFLLVVGTSTFCFAEDKAKPKTEAQHDAEEKERKEAIADIQKDLRKRHKTLKDEIAALTDPAEKKRAQDNLARLEGIMLEATVAEEICDYRTCRNEFCEGKYDCKHFTRDFCEERKKKTKETFCVAFGFLCTVGKKKTGHSLAMIKKDDKHCLIEPRQSAVLGCWKSAKTGSEVLSDYADEIETLISKYFDFFGKECSDKKGERLMFPYDSDITSFDEKILCCLCKDPKGDKTTVVAILSHPENMYCRGICEDRKEEYVKRTACTAEAVKAAKEKK